MAKTLKLRPYQEDAVQAVRRDWESGILNTFGTAATGAGKTCIFLEIEHRELEVFPQGRAVILAHRKELIEQPLARIGEFWPDMALKSGIVMGDMDQCDKQIVVATIQTLAKPERLERLLSYGAPSHLYIDEAHHAVADTYLSVYEAFRAANQYLRHHGVSATPIRADGKGLIKIYEKESYHEGIKELIQRGWLVPVRFLAIQTKIKLSEVKKSNGDYSGRSLANVFDTANCFELVIESYKKYAMDRPTLAFVSSIDGATLLADMFCDAGIEARAASSRTPKDERAQILKDFRAGRIKVLCNVDIYTEGLDVPQVSCILHVRPTQSDARYVQAIGRGLRLSPGKEDALILDFAPAETRNVVMMGDVLGIKTRKDAYLHDELERGEVMGGFTFDGKANFLEGDAAEILSRQLDYLEMTPWSWYRASDGWLSLGLGEAGDGYDRTLVISPVSDWGDVELWGVKRARGRGIVVQKLGSGELEDMTEIADEVISARGNAVLAEKNKQWRRKEPTPGQIKFANQLQVYSESMSRGEVAQAITHKLALDQVMRRIQR